jgi:hypothetical protein
MARHHFQIQKERKKQMSNSNLLRVIVALAIAIIMAGLPVHVIALAPPAPEQGIEAAEQDNEAPAAWNPLEVTTEQAVTSEPEAVADQPAEQTASPSALTPDGNMELVDDVSGEQSQDKQFITVVTKSGNYFYIVIDRAADSENVHFLNLVDEADLTALMGDEQVTATAIIEPEPVTPASIEHKPAPEPEPKNNLGAILAMVFVLALLGGGALLYFKVLKPKKSAANSGDVIDFDDFDSYDDEQDAGADDDTYAGTDDETGSYTYGEDEEQREDEK